MFYHSFPRPNRDQDNIKKGLAILKNFLKNGILLVPEIITYKRKKDVQQKTPKDYHVVQSRFCLTQTKIRDLKAHEKYFGCFHLEFTDDDAYDMGAIPMFYLPRIEPDTSEWSLKQLGSSYVYRLYELQIMCQAIKSIWNMVKNKPEEKTLIIEGENGVKEKTQHTVHAGEVKNILYLITVDLIPKLSADDRRCNDIGTRIDDILGALQGIGSLFYPTDKDYKNEHEDLYYFRQREWRIHSGIVVDGKRLDRELTLTEKKYLLSLDRRFYSKKILYADKKKRARLAGCSYMPFVVYESKTRPKKKTTEKSTVSKPVQELVQRIIVPKEALKEARAIAKQNNFDRFRIVTLKSPRKGDTHEKDTYHNHFIGRHRPKRLRPAVCRAGRDLPADRPGS